MESHEIHQQNLYEPLDNVSNEILHSGVMSLMSTDIVKREEDM